jgi:hypothetical protein
MTNQEKSPKTTGKSPRKESISERLEGLNTDPRRSQIGLLAENLVAIEKALSRGIPRVVVWEGLREEGLTLTFLSFETCLQRLRKRNAAKESSQPPATPVGMSPLTTKPPAAFPASINPGSTVSAHKVTQSVKPLQNEEEDEESRAIQEYKKSIAHLPAVQQGKKMADFIEKLGENRMSPTTRRWLEKTEP